MLGNSLVAYGDGIGETLKLWPKPLNSGCKGQPVDCSLLQGIGMYATAPAHDAPMRVHCSICTTEDENPGGRYEGKEAPGAFV